MTYLKWLRLHRNLTQVQAAKLASVSIRSWQRYEQGDSSPRSRAVASGIANALYGQFAFTFSNMDDCFLSAPYDELMNEHWFGKLQSDYDEGWETVGRVILDEQ